jgi:YHS domain-containing protein
MKRVMLVVMIALVAVAALAETPKLQRVEPKKVCMINEQVFEKDQIPVQVEGRTYYGCCEMCKKALASDASKRVAVDPVSRKEVDKAKAVIGALADGSVLYFENDKNFEKYAAELNRKK